MNEPTPTPTHDRSSWAARFHSRVYRYKRLLKQRWWIPFSCVFIALVIQGALSWFAPQRFISIGRMIVSIKLSIQETSVYTEELSNFLGTQQALMQSPVVVQRAHARAVAQRPDIVVQPAELSVAITPKTTIFVVRAIGHDPQYVKAFLQACMEEYIKLKREMREKTSDTTLAGLTEEILHLQRDLKKSDEELAEFQKTNSVVLLQEQGNNYGMYLASLTRKLADLKSEYDLLTTMTLDQNIERQRQQGVASTSSEAGSERGGGGRNANYELTYQKRTVLLAEKERLEEYLRPKHPRLIGINEEIAQQERLLNTYRKQTSEYLENLKKSLELQITNVEKDVVEWDAKNLSISQRTAEYQKLKAGQSRVQALYDRLLATMQTLDVNKEISPESVTIMEPAFDAVPERPPIIQSLFKAGLIGLGASLAILLLLDRLDDRMNSYTDLQDLFDEEVLGQIPHEGLEKGQKHLGLIHAEDPRHQFVEAYRNLRSSLLYMNEGGNKRRTLLVTSSVPNDGKSMTAANLAITLAITGSRTLLVDADLRKGLLHARFGLKPETGLSEVLLAKKDWRNCICKTGVANLDLLPRGGTTQRSSELFVHQDTKDFLKAAAAEYDCVVVDTAPVMAADDVTSLAPLIDGTIFVIRAGETSGRVARAALELLYQRNVPVLGLVFNAVQTGSGDYYYYYRYKDYYKPYPAKPA
ncbi:MAG: polysaccharide biosynthesis tyrosine autokinase [Verrucomicrobia bacterium]|nr:MAG: polysaccharide biosynthesis tyrosine autokinase [Verrucomicrobiota bacterium]